MKKYWKKYTVCLCAALTAILCLPYNVSAATERIVILAPAAADIVEQLGCGDSVVGVTNSVEEFPEAERIGTHINPCVECIASLKPTLLITTDKFPADVAAKLKAEQYIYEPQDIMGILEQIDALGKRLDMTKQADDLIKKYSGMIQSLKKPRPMKTVPKVTYEIRSDPLTLAGENTIIQDALERAGFVFTRAEEPTSQVSVETVMSKKMDFYLYQVGPMNINPLPPKERAGWTRFKANCVWKVDEKVFARPNTRIFEEIVKINAILDTADPCATGLKEGYKP